MLRVTYFGQTSFLLESQEVSVLLNPGIWNGTPVVPETTDVQVIIATNHLDDAVGNAKTIADNAKSWILGNEKTIEKVKEQGGKPWLLHVLKPNESYEIPGLRVTPHPLKRKLPEKNEYVENIGLFIEIGKMRVSYLGDAAIRGPFGQFETDILIVPIGGNEVFPLKDAVALCIDAKPRLGIPMRWTTEEQLQKFVKYVDQFAHGCTPLIMKPNMTIVTEWAAGTDFKFEIV